MLCTALVENSREESLLLYGGVLHLAENYGIYHPSPFQDEVEICYNTDSQTSLTTQGSGF